ncbi:M1 family aminopeptidase [Sphingobacterium spiritivorum]
MKSSNYHVMKNVVKTSILSILITTCILITTISKAQKITHYEGKVSIDSLKCINAAFNISYLNGDKNELDFYINKNADIKQFRFGNESVDYKVEEVVEDLKRISIKNIFPKKFVLNIVYTYPLDKIESKIFTYNPNWIELSLYTGWFPVNIDDKNYSYQLNFKVPENYDIIGNGVVRKKGLNTMITNSSNHFDIPVVLSGKFQRFSTRNNKIKFFSVQLPSEKIEEIQETSLEMYSFYESRFGKSATDNLIVTVNPFAHDMSYARRGFISLSLLDNYGLVDRKVLAHEIAHLWWQNAKTGVWEDWLNESFAEFSTLKWMEKTLSDEIFQKQLKKYEDAYKKPVKVSKTKTGDTDWHSVAYFKGPYMLYQLEKNIGEEKMLQFLKKVYKDKISTTEKLIELLKHYADEKSVKILENEIY